MQYLGLALYAEGPTDYYFLRPLLLRLCEDLCTREAQEPVDVSEVLSLDHPLQIQDSPRAQRILEAAKMSQDAWQILFVHADGSNDPERIRKEQVTPGLELLRDSINSIGIAVVPIRETEAWMIADGDAIRQVFGTNKSNAMLSLPAHRAAEKAADPKAILQAAFKAAQPLERQRKRGLSPYLNALGEQVALDCLRELSAFAELEKDLRTALKRLKVLH
ncbi:MAG: DUF4276 family protein [Castellaniella sp.]